MSTTTFYDIVLTNIVRYPLAQETDLYKLCHQAALGSEHAVKSISDARAWLNNELDELARVPSISLDEPLIETISPDNQIVRINLRPFIRAGGDPDKLLQAFVKTANRRRGNTDLLQRYWKSIIQLAERREISFQPQLLVEFMIEKAANGFPAVHHSQIYKQAYRPSYRVIAGEFLIDVSPV